MALYRITCTHRSRNHIHVDHNNSRANPRTQEPVSGGFHLALSVLYCLTDQRWIIRGHQSASIRACTTRLFLTRKAPYCGHYCAIYRPIFSPLSNHHWSWLLHAPIQGRYKANKEPDNNHGVTLVIARPSKRLYLAIIGPDKDQSPAMALIGSYTGSKLVTIGLSLTIIWSPLRQLLPVAGVQAHSYVASQPRLQLCIYAVINRG